MHHTRCTDDDVGKPEIIAYYNRTKGGVDTLDEKCSRFSSSRRTRRWPMAVFFQMLDISVANSHIIYTSGLNNAELSTGNFLKMLAKELVTPHMKRKLANPRVPFEIKLGIKRIIGPGQEMEEARTANEEEILQIRKICYLCPRPLKRKTKYICTVCKNPVCLECTHKLCKECKNKM